MAQTYSFDISLLGHLVSAKILAVPPGVDKQFSKAAYTASTYSPHGDGWLLESNIFDVFVDSREASAIEEEYIDGTLTDTEIVYAIECKLDEQ